MTERDSGARLDRFLAETLPGHTRSRWQKAIEAGAVTVGGQPAAAGRRLKAGEWVEAREPGSSSSHLEPEDLPLRVVHEDRDLVVIDKPAGLVVHPGAGRRTGTLANALAHHFRDLPSGGGGDRPGIVHRLDKDTSGLMVVARSERAHAALSKALAERRVERRYWGMVWGDPGERGVMEAPIGRHPRERVKMAVRPEGRAAATEFHRLTAYGFASELELRLRTGRTHQIRVHLSNLRHPVVGDAVYGGLEPRAGVQPVKVRRALVQASRTLGRQALHAARLRFEHPAGGGMLDFESPLPPELEELRASFRALSPGG